MNTAHETRDQWPGLAFTKADRLHKSLEYAEMTVQDMADALDVSRQTVGNYTSGRTRIPTLALKEWALRTGVPLEWLETGEFPENEKRPPIKGDRKMNLQTLDYRAAGTAEVIHMPVRGNTDFASTLQKQPARLVHFNF